MRPKKIILYVSASETDLGLMRFMLMTRGYQVLTASSGEQAIETFKENAVELVLADALMPLSMGGLEIVAKLKQIGSHIPMILLGDTRKMPDNIEPADQFLDKKRLPMSGLLEYIKVMSARKRGPKKGWDRTVAA